MITPYVFVPTNSFGDVVASAARAVGLRQDDPRIADILRKMLKDPRANGNATVESGLLKKILEDAMLESGIPKLDQAVLDRAVDLGARMGEARSLGTEAAASSPSAGSSGGTRQATTATGNVAAQAGSWVSRHFATSATEIGKIYRDGQGFTAGKGLRVGGAVVTGAGAVYCFHKAWKGQELDPQTGEWQPMSWKKRTGYVIGGLASAVGAVASATAKGRGA